MTEPRRALDAACARTTLVSPVKGQVRGMRYDVHQDTLSVELPLEQCNPEDFDALMLPGGVINSDSLRVKPRAQQLA